VSSLSDKLLIGKALPDNALIIRARLLILFDEGRDISALIVLLFFDIK
jgi:hypothetical protein